MNSFTVPGRPLPYLRVTQRSTWTKQYKRYQAYKQHVADSFLKADIAPYGDCILSVSVIAYLHGGGRYNQGRDADVDNYLKAALDGLNKVAFDDDRQVMRVTARKVSCATKEDERLEVMIQDYFE